MSPTDLTSLPRSYWQASRAPRYSLLFALPLLVGYELLTLLAPSGPAGATGIRNGADVILQSLFVAIAGDHGPFLFMGCLVAVAGWLVVRDLRRGGKLRPILFAGMFAESLVLALVCGLVVGSLTRSLLGGAPPLSLSQVEHLPWTTRLMLSIGAGLYEELLFRVLLVAGLAWAGRRVLGWQPLTAGAVATVVGAAIFSAFHYLGPYGDQWQVFSFVYRMIAGLFFSALYLLRGFGITAWTHALYDIFVLVL
jgi:membrane protease YdiL (CAAX protease family)